MIILNDLYKNEIPQGICYRQWRESVALNEPNKSFYTQKNYCSVNQQILPRTEFAGLWKF